MKLNTIVLTGLFLVAVSGCQNTAEGLQEDTTKNGQKSAEQSKDLATMYEWFETTGFAVDIDALHREYPEVHWHTFEQWVKQRNLGYRIHPPRKEYHQS